jgi:DNA processing protein
MQISMEEAVALTCLRAEPGSRSALELKLLLAEPEGPDLIGRLAERLGIPDRERARRIGVAHAYARRHLERGKQQGLRPLAWFDSGYPGLLREIVDPPVVLWLKGDEQFLQHPAVAIVGSRTGTPTGVKIAGEIAHSLAAVGLTVVSGMARGIDAAGHTGALDAGGATVAVLGSGADVIYPPEHGPLAGRITGHGALISEFAPGTSPESHHFPLRNRIISGLSRAVIVIEASDRSGSLITARMALEQGREVMAVPGNVLSGRSRGCHALIRDGARLVETARDVLEELGLESPIGNSDGSTRKTLPINSLEAMMAAGEPYSLDELETMTGRTTSDLLVQLADLELGGRVARVPGGNFLRLDGRC